MKPISLIKNQNDKHNLSVGKQQRKEKHKYDRSNNATRTSNQQPCFSWSRKWRWKMRSKWHNKPIVFYLLLSVGRAHNKKRAFRSPLIRFDWKKSCWLSGKMRAHSMNLSVATKSTEVSLLYFKKVHRPLTAILGCIICWQGLLKT